MSALRLNTPSRLHFGLLAYGPDAPRQFGGLGLMIERPGLEVSASPAGTMRASGPLAERALQVALTVADGLRAMDLSPPPASIVVHRAPPEHVGFGTGTQLGLAVARLLSVLAGAPDLPASTLARLAGRGLRSGIGLHGFERGGLLVDGGHRDRGAVAPLVARAEWPEDWSVFVLLPREGAGLHGSNESQAFRTLPPIPESTTDRLCGLILLGVLPALAERDLPRFGESLAEIQRLVGGCFAPAQGGPFSDPKLADVAASLERSGLLGVGQSSWGPVLYGFLHASDDRRDAIRRQILAQWDLDESHVFWTVGNNRGAVLG